MLSKDDAMINALGKYSVKSRSRKLLSSMIICDLLVRHPNCRLGGAEMWKPEHRRAAERRGLRYPSDLTDAEWALVEPMIPPAKRGGRRREVNVREVLNAIFYVLSTGCQWQALPKDLPPKSTAHSYFMLWDWDER